MLTKCPLHLADSLEALSKHIASTSNTRNWDKLCRLSDKLYDESLRYSKQNPLDEELLYIFCSRYMKLVSAIKNQVGDDVFYKVRFAKHIATIDTIKKECESSLSMRYKSNIVPILPSENETVEAIGDVQIENKPPMMHLIKDDDMFITIDVLYQLMINLDVKMLIIDARLSKEFGDSPIKYGNVLNVPDEVIRKGLTTNTLQKLLAVDSAEVFKQRHRNDYIVLMDNDTTRISYPSTKLEDLRSILVHWDIDQQYKLLPLVLDGGIKVCADKYPSCITNVQKVYNKFFVGLEELMGEISYPDLFNSSIEDAAPDSNENDIPTVEPETLEEAVISEKPKKTDYGVIVILNKILTIARQQFKNEAELLNLVMKRTDLNKSIILEKSSDDDIRKCDDNIVKLETFKLVLEERRILYMNEYNKLKVITHEVVLNELLEEIDHFDKERAIKARQRNEIEAMDLEYKRKIPVGQKVSVDNKLKFAPKIIPKPDRQSKPGEVALLQKLGPYYLAPGLTGLVNIRNTCYLNSLIQCLRYCPVFLDYLLTAKFNSTKSLLNFCFAELMKEMFSEKNVVVCPNNFYRSVCKVDNYEKGYANGRHEDVHEFFVFLTKYLHMETKDNLNVKSWTAKLKDWLKNFDGQISLINQMFFYQIEITLNCDSCSKCIVKYEYGNTVFIPLPPTGEAINLKEKVAEYINSTEDFAELRFCKKCEKKMFIRKTVTHYPSILAVNIVRYDFSRTENCILRRNNECIFQPELFFGTQKYLLKSVSLHSGNRDSGHYTALCWNPSQMRFILYNDSIASYVNEITAEYRIKCYMAFYTLKESSQIVNNNFFPRES